MLSEGTFSRPLHLRIILQQNKAASRTNQNTEPLSQTMLACGLSKKSADRDISAGSCKFKKNSEVKNANELVYEHSPKVRKAKDIESRVSSQVGASAASNNSFSQRGPLQELALLGKPSDIVIEKKSTQLNVDESSAVSGVGVQTSFRNDANLSAGDMTRGM